MLNCSLAHNLPRTPLVLISSPSMKKSIVSLSDSVSTYYVSKDLDHWERSVKLNSMDLRPSCDWPYPSAIQENRKNRVFWRWEKTMSFQELICKIMLRFSGAVVSVSFVWLEEGAQTTQLSHAVLPHKADEIHNDNRQSYLSCQKITEKPTAWSIWCASLQSVNY